MSVKRDIIDCILSSGCDLVLITVDLKALFGDQEVKQYRADE